MKIEYAVRQPLAEHLPSATDGLYQALFEQTRDAIVIATMHGGYIATNQHACVLLGYTRAELLGMTWWDVLLADYPAAGMRTFEDLRAGETLHGERRVRCKNGRMRDVAISAHRVANAYIVMFLRDITEQRQTEHELQFKSDLLDHLLAATETDAPVADNLSQAETTYSINPPMHKQIEQAVNQHQRADGGLELAVGERGGAMFETTMTVEKAIGWHKNVIAADPSFDNTAQPSAAQTADQRLAQEARLTAIAAIAPGVLFSLHIRPDGSSCMPYASAAIHALCGLQPEDLIDDATPLFARIHPDDMVVLIAAVADSKQTMQPVRVEYRINHPDQGEIWVESHAAPARDPDGSTL